MRYGNRFVPLSDCSYFVRTVGTIIFPGSPPTTFKSQFPFTVKIARAISRNPRDPTSDRNRYFQVASVPSNFSQADLRHGAILKWFQGNVLSYPNAPQILRQEIHAKIMLQNTSWPPPSPLSLTLFTHMYSQLIGFPTPGPWVVPQTSDSGGILAVVQSHKCTKKIPFHFWQIFLSIHSPHKSGTHTRSTEITGRVLWKVFRVDRIVPNVPSRDTAIRCNWTQTGSRNPSPEDLNWTT